MENIKYIIRNIKYFLMKWCKKLDKIHLLYKIYFIKYKKYDTTIKNNWFGKKFNKKN